MKLSPSIAVTRWLEEANECSTDQMALELTSFRALKDLGPEVVVPELLKVLREETYDPILIDHALRSLTGSPLSGT